MNKNKLNIDLSEATKVGRINELFEEIESYLARGIGYNKIAISLRELGIEVTGTYLCTVMRRLRKSYNEPKKKGDNINHDQETKVSKKSESTRYVEASKEINTHTNLVSYKAITPDSTPSKDLNSKRPQTADEAIEHALNNSTISQLFKHSSEGGNGYDGLDGRSEAERDRDAYAVRLAPDHHVHPLLQKLVGKNKEGK